MPRGFDTRVGAYGVIVDAGNVLLAHFCENGASSWTLPGGGLERGEDPPAAAVREIHEETGYHATLDALLGIDSVHVPVARRIDGFTRDLHFLRVIYLARVHGGVLTPERGGSTDDARWMPLTEVATLSRASLVDVGLRLWSAGRGPVFGGTSAVPTSRHTESRGTEE
ncbi:MAG: NUDIX domain-containing protein [Trueperaceae bacterium]